MSLHTVRLMRCQTITLTLDSSERCDHNCISLKVSSEICYLHCTTGLHSDRCNSNCKSLCNIEPISIWLSDCFTTRYPSLQSYWIGTLLGGLCIPWGWMFTDGQLTIISQHPHSLHRPPSTSYTRKKTDCFRLKYPSTPILLDSYSHRGIMHSFGGVCRMTANWRS